MVRQGLELKSEAYSLINSTLLKTDLSCYGKVDDAQIEKKQGFIAKII